MIKKYKENSRPDRTQIEAICLHTKLNHSQISDWFNKRRSNLYETQQRIRISEKNIKVLKREYEKDRFPTAEKQKQISNDLKLEFKTVNGWFKYTRQKLGHTEKEFKRLDKNDVNYMIKKYEMSKRIPTINIVIVQRLSTMRQ